MAAIAIVRIRGQMRLMQTIADTMQNLRLTRANHCVVLQDTPEVMGMIRKAKDYITWGEVSVADVENLIRTRGRLVGDKPITDADVAKTTEYKTIKDLAAAVHGGKIKFAQIEGFKPLFRLSPPKKGFKGGIKRSIQAQGSLGNRGKKMPELLTRMM
jgi:large subunit ribosomal protein L30